MQNIYKQRDIDNLVQGVLARGETVLLVGESGTGKTSMCEQIAKNLFLPFLRVALDDSATLRDFIGTLQAKDGATFFEPGLLLDALQNPGVILFDEFNSLPASRLFFMHELLDHRKLFVKELKKSFDVHPECYIALACNPPNIKYSGTNKMNAALIDRCTVVNVPLLMPEEVPELFDTGDLDTSKQLAHFYIELNKAIRAKNIRSVFSLRAIQRITAALKQGVAIQTAVKIALSNGAELTGGEVEREAINDVAKACFRNFF